jgi:tetratricopeptide (TPR) repeat protein
MQWNDWLPGNKGLIPGYEAWREGRLEDARVFFEEKAEEQPHSADTWRGLGNVAWTMKDFTTALSHFSTALSLEPWSPMHWSNMGLVRRDLGQPEAAIAAFRVALGLDREYAPALNEWANVLFDVSLYEYALPLYDASLAIDNSRAVVHHNKGVCLRHLGRVIEAEQYFRMALTLDPNYRYSLEELQRLSAG